MHEPTAAAFFSTIAAANDAVSALQAAGVSDDAISIVERPQDHDNHADEVHESGTILKGTIVGAGAGTVLGIAALAVPGVGPVAAAGAIAAMTIPEAAALGGVAGATYGGLSGRLANEDRQLVEAVNDGCGIFVAVVENGAISLEAARNIFLHHGGQLAGLSPD